jgi:hypothetical protein
VPWNKGKLIGAKLLLRPKCNIIDFESDNIAAAELAVDRQVEQGQVARFALDLELGAD